MPPPPPVVVPVVALVVSVAVVVPPVALSVAQVVVLGTPNSCCAKAKEVGAKTPVTAIEKSAAAMSNPFVDISFVGRDLINQSTPNKLL